MSTLKQMYIISKIIRKECPQRIPGLKELILKTKIKIKVT